MNKKKEKYMGWEWVREWRIISMFFSVYGVKSCILDGDM